MIPFGPLTLVVLLVVVYGPIMIGIAWAISFFRRRSNLKELFALVGWFAAAIAWLLFWVR